VTKADFQKLADMRIREAKILLDAGEFDGAFYLAGYAVECALKACIIRRQIPPDSWPEKKFMEKCYSHKLEDLLILADLKATLNTAGPVSGNWGLVSAWTEQSRYEIGKTTSEATQLYDSITDANVGVLQWLKTYW
jgi:hypothetical protein